MQAKNTLADYFDRIYIINLAERQDRRDEMSEQLSTIQLSLTHPKIQLFPAIKPDSAGQFDSIGARGCFSSHLEILKHAKSLQLNRILILEDDLNFSHDFNKRIDQSLRELDSVNWEFFYGGYHLQNEFNNTSNAIIVEISPATRIFATHFVAFQGKLISDLVDYLELLLTRKNGDPRGGPMHVDGAYSSYREKGSKAFIAFPELGYQRASRTDIHQLSWQDKLPVFRHVLNYLRKLKNKLAKR